MDQPPLGWRTKTAYAFSAIPTLVQQRGMSAFLLIFYNQALGLAPGIVATVLLISSIVEALCDPIVGQISDNFSSRWGRRHPFMYVAILPVSIGYLLLWAPPAGLSDGILAAYLLITLLTIRIFDAFFELPSSALLPELTRNYDERTTLVSLRLMLGMIVGLSMTMLAYKVFLRENANGSGGVLIRDGYLSYGIASALLIAAAMLIAALGTHSRIPYLAKAGKRAPSPGAMWREVRATLHNRSFIGLVTMGMLMSIATGAKSALDLYFGLYFWGLTQSQLAGLVGATLAGLIAGVILVPHLSRILGSKKRAAACVVIGAIAGSVGPVLARLVDIMPANGTKTLFAILFADNIFSAGTATMTAILVTSMMNDVVEDAEVRTGRRSEGLLLAADSLGRKLVSSVGIFLSGMTLTLIGFPAKAERGTVALPIVEKLAYGYIPMTVLYLLGLAMLHFYRIDRSVHEANLKTLRDRSADSSQATDERALESPSRGEDFAIS
jgi:Na+/melibiose symporter-like transporter